MVVMPRRPWGVAGSILYMQLKCGAGDLVVIHSATSAKGPGFNSPFVRAYWRFNFRASTLAGKQYFAMRCTVAPNCDRVVQCR